MRMFGQYDHSSFDTLAHDKHRMRREPWNPYFSKQSVTKLQPLLIQNCVNKLCDRLAEHQAAGKSVIMTYAYACLTADVISEYSFPSGYGFLDRRPDFSFNGAHYESWMALSKISHLFKQCGWLYPLLDSMPLWFIKATSPETYMVIREQQVLLAQSHAIAAQRSMKSASDYKETTGRPSLIEAIMDSPMLPESEKSPERVKGEAVIAIGAGTLTSTHAMKNATYHILANPSVFARLMHDLETTIPDPINAPPNLRELESIDYLMAILYETLRVFYGVSHRLQRIFPDRPLLYTDTSTKGVVGKKTWSIPPGTPVSMTSVHIHDNETIFPDHRTFNPERWLPLKTNGVRLQRYLVPFSKGSRQCVGMELGKAEILTGLANVFRRFGRRMRLVDCVRERDVDCVYDVFNPLPSRENNGLVVAFDGEG